MTSPSPLEPPPAAPEEFSRGSVLPGAVAGCALPVVGVLLAFLLGLGLIIWSGVREDDGPGPDDLAGGPGVVAYRAPVSADR